MIGIFFCVGKERSRIVIQKSGKASLRRRQPLASSMESHAGRIHPAVQDARGSDSAVLSRFVDNTGICHR